MGEFEIYDFKNNNVLRFRYVRKTNGSFFVLQQVLREVEKLFKAFAILVFTIAMFFGLLGHPKTKDLRMIKS